MSSKYFSSPLQDFEREGFAHVLGLTQWNFLLIEKVRGEILRSTEVFNGRVKTVLNENTILQTFNVDHAVAEPEEYRRAGVRLWKEIVPHPFFLLPQCGGLPFLWKAFCEFEEALMGSELSVLKVDSPFGSMNLLFHYVRGRCVRVGTTVWPREFGTSVRLFEIQNDGIMSPPVLTQLIENTIKNPVPLEILAPQAHPPIEHIELSS